MSDLRTLLPFFVVALIACGPRRAESPRAPAPRADAALTAFLLPRATMHAHVRMDALSALAPDGDGLKVLASLSADALPEALDLSSTCGIATAEAIDELAVSVDAEGVLMAVRTPLRDVAARRCAMALSRAAEATRFEGREAVRIDDLVVVVDGGLVLLGSEAHVRDALEAPPGGTKADPMETMGAPPEAFVRVHSQLDDEGLYAGGLMQLGPAGDDVALSFALFSPTVTDADQLDHRYRKTLGLLREQHAEALRQLVPLMDRVEVQRSVGATTLVRAILPDDDLVTSIGRMSELHHRIEAGLVVWRYIEFAESQLHQLAQALADHVARERDKGRPARFPPSAGPTPATPPPLEGTAMTRHDWRDPTWVILGHALEGQVFHQYQLEVHPSRRKATLRARSDLDADGVPFVLEIELTIQRDGTVAIGTLTTVASG